MVKHIEVPALVRATALIAEIDTEEGFPRSTGVIGAKSAVDRAAAEAWVANPVGDPPPGVTRTWDVPLTHPTEPARYSVQVTDAQMTGYLIGRQPAGFPGPIQAGHAVERGPEWFAGLEGFSAAGARK